MTTTTDIRTNMSIVWNGHTWLVQMAQFVNPGKGSAFTRAKLKNLRTGQVVENTFRSGEAVELAEVENKRCQYLYNDGTNYVFMGNDDYEQFSLDKDFLGDATKYLIDGTEVYAMYIDGNPVSIQLPPKMNFKVVSTPPGVRGDTASGGSKEATIETGAVVRVPLFIEEGETIRVNTETGAYDGKAN